MREALKERDDRRRIMETIKATVCARCGVTVQCGRCDDLFIALARAVTQFISR
jgi:hypothetical protein